MKFTRNAEGTLSGVQLELEKEIDARVDCVRFEHAPRVGPCLWVRVNLGKVNSFLSACDEHNTGQEHLLVADEEKLEVSPSNGDIEGNERVCSSGGFSTKANTRCTYQLETHIPTEERPPRSFPC